MNDVKEFASPRGTAGARRLHRRRPAVDRRPHPGSSRQRPLDTRHLGRGIRAALRRLSRRQARCRCELRHFSTRDHFPRFGRRGPRRARSGQLQLRYSSCRRSCRRTSGAHWYRGGDAGHGAPRKSSAALRQTLRGSHGCFRTRQLSPLCGSFFPKGNGAPREGVRGHNTSLIKTG